MASPNTANGYVLVRSADSGHIAYALHCLGHLGYETYAPRLRTVRVSHGRKIERRSLLFPSYAFLAIVSQWHEARRAPGVVRLVMAGDGAPAQVPDAVISHLRARERDGAIELTEPSQFEPGDEVRIIRGPFQGHAALFAGKDGHERVAVLLQLLGGSQRAELAADAIEPMGAQAVLQDDGDHRAGHRLHRHRGRRRPGKKHRDRARALGQGDAKSPELGI
jgi:transcriptional antiterminator RfaH